MIVVVILGLKLFSVVLIYRMTVKAWNSFSFKWICSFYKLWIRVPKLNFVLFLFCDKFFLFHAALDVKLMDILALRLFWIWAGTTSDAVRIFVEEAAKLIVLLNKENLSGVLTSYLRAWTHSIFSLYRCHKVFRFT